MRKAETIQINANFSNADFITVVKLTLSTVNKASEYIEYKETIDIYTMNIKRLETTYLFSLYKHKSLIAEFDIFYITKEFIMLNFRNIESNVIAEVLEKKLGFKQAFS